MTDHGERIERAREAIKRAVARWGLRVGCYCGWEGRHYPAQGRLADRQCPECGSGLFSLAARRRALIRGRTAGRTSRG